MGRRIRVFLLTVGMVSCFIISGIGTSAEDYFPDSDWRTATPEEQGMDSGKLVEMLRDIKRDNVEIRSLIIIRHGFMVMECYREPYTRETGYNIKSVTKSILSALAGIAIREKYISDLDQKIVDCLPKYLDNRTVDAKKEITLRQMLTMTAGLQPVDGDNGKWARSKDWVKYTLDMPVKAVPGSSFDYNTGLTQLMAAIITKTSGMNTLDFGRKYLFDPLGISVKKWLRDPQGIYLGGSELWLKPLDMARFGYLYLHHGFWRGRSIVPKEWVSESVRNQVGSLKSYGFWWWPTQHDYQALGWGGQSIVVNPALDLVVVMTAADFNKPGEYLWKYIYPAVKNPMPLEPNPATTGRMRSLIAELAGTGPDSAKPALEIVRVLQGKTFVCQRNKMGLTVLSLDFNNPAGKLILKNGKTVFPIELDGQYRVRTVKSRPTYFGARPLLPDDEPGGSDEYQMAFRGRWEDERTVLMEWQNYLGEPVQLTARIRFESKTAIVTFRAFPQPWGETFQFSGKLH